MSLYFSHTADHENPKEWVATASGHIILKAKQTQGLKAKYANCGKSLPEQRAACNEMTLETNLKQNVSVCLDRQLGILGFGNAPTHCLGCRGPN